MPAADSRRATGNGSLSTAAAIRAEAMRPNLDGEGRPLPLACHWNSGVHPFAGGWGPMYQLDLIQQGHYILPSFSHPPREARSAGATLQALASYYERPIKKAREQGLPLVFIASQWESGLSDEPFLGLEADKNPNVIALDGKIRRQVSPFGPVAPWRQIGRQWTANQAMRRIQEWYPDPPLVIFLSNNEHARLPWTKVEESKRYMAEYGGGKADDFKRKVVGDGWIQRYRELQEGMREGLDLPAWRKAARFVGYEAFGPEFIGRWGGWPTHSLHTAGRISPYPLMWDGGSPSYYTHDWNASTDYTTWSPQVESMNMVFMQEEAFRLNPNFWFELSIWDGYDGPTRGKQFESKRAFYRGKGQSYTPDRYGGFVQLGMWLLRPRAVREFRGYTFPASEGMPYYSAILAAVDRVHANPTLREFWRKGALAPNRARAHPYQAVVPDEYAAVDRWFLLDADVNPSAPQWTLSQPIAVLSLALILGEAPQRRWLVYSHAPLGDRRGVKITLPGYKEMALDVTVGGSFHVVDEKTGRVQAVK